MVDLLVVSSIFKVLRELLKNVFLKLKLFVLKRLNIEIIV